MTQTSGITMAVFVIYILGVFVLAGLSHQLLSRKSFLGEYFLGSRGLGTWALALTFAATSASGGSFGGYPSLIYSHGWILAFWIAGYMIMPLVTMGLLGKRLNQVARKTDAITIPDVLRDRFESTTVGLIASCLIIFFSICFLVAQFKLGALIIEDTFNLKWSRSYEISLLVFAVTVIVYTAYGGFRAVVWTDVMQGIVMGIGVVVLVPIVLSKTGGLENTTRELANQAPLAITSVPGPEGKKGTFNDLAVRAIAEPIPAELVYLKPVNSEAVLKIAWANAVGDGQVVQVTMATDADGTVTTTANDIKQAIEQHPEFGQILEVEIPYKNDKDGQGATGVIGFPKEASEYRYTFLHGEEFLFGPGRTNKGSPFHSLGLIISFFFMWTIIGMAQPVTLVRLMAFKDSRTLNRAMMTVTIYYALIYLPLVFVVMAARSELPLLTPEDSDRAIVLVATRVVAGMGIWHQALGAIFVAAPFAAVMSTVDSLLLLISSGAVRDIYQRSINPHVGQRTMKWASYAMTVIVGVVVTVLATHPPDFLQKIIVFVAGGTAAVFLWPMVLGLYWPGMTRQGAIASMLGGFSVVVGLFGPTWVGHGRINLMGFHPAFWGVVASLVLAIVVSKISGPPPSHLTRKYFSRASGVDQ